MKTFQGLDSSKGKKNNSFFYIIVFII